MNRLIYIAFTALLTRLRLRTYNPTGAKVKTASGYTWEYPCFSCNAPSKHGYQPHQTRKKHKRPGMDEAYHSGLCERCYERRRLWHWKTWLETGETITVPEVDGEGWISPSTTRGSRTYRVYRLFGFEVVSASAARQGRTNSLNARHWFQRLRVEGNSEGVKKAESAQGNVMILTLADD